MQADEFSIVNLMKKVFKEARLLSSTCLDLVKVGKLRRLIGCRVTRCNKVEYAVKLKFTSDYKVLLEDKLTAKHGRVTIKTLLANLCPFYSIKPLISEDSCQVNFGKSKAKAQ